MWKIEKPLVGQGKGENMQWKIRKERGSITTDPINIKRKISEYYKRLGGNIIEKLKEMDKKNVGSLYHIHKLTQSGSKT